MALREQEKTSIVNGTLHIMRQLIMAQKLDSDQTNWDDRYKLRKLTYDGLGDAIKNIAPGVGVKPYPEKESLPHYQKP